MSVGTWIVGTVPCNDRMVLVSVLTDPDYNGDYIYKAYYNKKFGWIADSNHNEITGDIEGVDFDCRIVDVEGWMDLPISIRDINKRS